MEKLKDKRKQSGITLIALIITIIVLLILAGVAINTLTGEGSIIANANKVVEMNNIANVKEKIELEIIGTILKENNEVTLDKIIDDLIDKGITTEENSDRESGQIKTEEGYIFQIEETENGSYEVEYVGNGEFVKESIHISYELSTNGIANKVIITIRASAESGIKSYEINGENRKTYGEGTTNIEETYEVTANGTYIIKITNNNGEEKTKEIEISNILEGTIQMMPDKTSPTRDNVKITIIWPTGSERGIKEIKVGNNQWQSASGEKSEVEVTENCTVQARVRNSNEDVIASSITISNIDKNNPTVTVTTSGTETITEGTSNEIGKYFTYSSNGTAEITSVTYTDTSNGDAVVTNTNTLAVGTHIIKCTVTKETGAVASATKTIEIEKKEIVISDGNWTGEVNSPMLMEGMTAVYWSTDGGVTASTTEEGATEIYAKIDSNGKASSTGTDNLNFKWENWYAYTAGDNSTDTKTSRWANAVTDDGSYWVWIPRYKYKITNQPTEVGIENAGKIDVEFIPTTDKMGTAGYTTEANTDGEILTTDSEGYIIHPAFENGSSSGKNNGYANGEWDSELPGFWIAKYEMSGENGSGESIEPGNVAISADVKMVSKPNVSSWRSIQIGQIYQNCINYDTGKDSHMIKNSEWGAVAYLTHSQYGRNGNEITINNNSNYITGIAGDTETASSSSSTENAYNTSDGMLASTTGNIYGVYDLSGGAWEYTAGWDTESSDPMGWLEQYGQSIGGTQYFNVGMESDRTKTAYRNGTNEYDGEKIKEVCRTGDGIKETWISGSDSWFNDDSYCVYSYGPFSMRGGDCNDEDYAGVFYSADHLGGPAGAFSFRAVLARGV